MRSFFSLFDPGLDPIVIYGANPCGKIVYELLEDKGRLAFFIDDQGPNQFHGLPVRDASGFLTSDEKGGYHLLLAKRVSGHGGLAQAINLIPLAILASAAPGVDLAVLCGGERVPVRISITALSKSAGCVAHPLPDAIAAVCAILACIRCSLSAWRGVLRELIAQRHLDGKAWSCLAQVLQWCRYTKVRYLVFRLARRIDPQDFDIARELALACWSLTSSFLQTNRKQAVKWAKRTCRHAALNRPEWQESYLLAKTHAVAAEEFMGMEVPIAIIARAQALRAQKEPVLPRLHLSHHLFSRIGSTMHAECLIKSQKLGWSPETPLVCVYPPCPWGNEHLVFKYLTRYIQFIPEHEAAAALLAERDRFDAYFELVMDQRGMARFTPAATIAARNAWLQRGYAPLFSLDQADRAYGAGFLKSQGLDPATPFVAVHCRHEFQRQTDFRNSALEQIIPTIQWLREQGFNVIRLGDAGMPRLAPMKGVVDLTGFAFDPRLHLFFLAAPLFYVGSASGPLTVPPCFGVSTVSFDSVPLGAVCGTPRDTYLPNVVVRTASGQRVRWDEAFTIAAGIAHFDHQWRTLGLAPIANSAEDILEAVQFHAYRHGLVSEGRIGGLPQPSTEQIARFETLAQFEATAHAEPIRAQISFPFVARYAHLHDGVST